MLKPECWEAICYAAGTARKCASVILTQRDCEQLAAWVAYLCETPEQRLAILDSHVVELLELLTYDGKTLGAPTTFVGETLDQYQERKAETKEPFVPASAREIERCRCALQKPDDKRHGYFHEQGCPLRVEPALMIHELD